MGRPDRCSLSGPSETVAAFSLPRPIGAVQQVGPCHAQEQDRRPRDQSATCSTGSEERRLAPMDVINTSTSGRSRPGLEEWTIAQSPSPAATSAP